jgi:hypothetical protein
MRWRRIGRSDKRAVERTGSVREFLDNIPGLFPLTSHHSNIIFEMMESSTQTVWKESNGGILGRGRGRRSESGSWIWTEAGGGFDRSNGLWPEQTMIFPPGVSRWAFSSELGHVPINRRRTLAGESGKFLHAQGRRNRPTPGQPTQLDPGEDQCGGQLGGIDHHGRNHDTMRRQQGSSHRDAEGE